ncbi:nucleotidyltransferase [Clostridia bacterium]|nr:nucleotidyltransferase [Clostridia bacterium]
MNDNKEVRWKQRFQNFSRAFLLLRELDGQNLDLLKPIEQEGFIQRFEYTFELAWKTAKDYLTEQGVTLSEITPRTVLKSAFAAGIISNGQGFIDMLNSRNLLSHTYDFETFRDILAKVQAEYLQALEEFHGFLSEKLYD